VTCPHAASPHDCFSYHRQALLSVRHSWERIVCSVCSHARPNAILAHVPEPDSKPRPSGAASPYRCAECGKHLHRIPIGGLCKECKSRAYGTVKKQCSDCGAVLSASMQRAPGGTTRCRKCYQASRKAAGCCTVSGCKNKSRRRGLCARHTTPLRGDK
jgi:hypothetical protein